MWVNGYQPGAEDRLSRPMTLDGQRLRPAGVRVIQAAGGTALFSVVIHEGKNRQVRKMFSAVGNRVQSLERTAIGDIRLGHLQTGHYRKLTREEIDYLKRL